MIHPAPEPAGPHQYGDRYVRCDVCGVLRPALTLYVASSDPVTVMCIDRDWCINHMFFKEKTNDNQDQR